MYISILDENNLRKLIPCADILDITFTQIEEELTSGEINYTYKANITYSNLNGIELQWNYLDPIASPAGIIFTQEHVVITSINLAIDKALAEPDIIVPIQFIQTVGADQYVINLRPISGYELTQAGGGNTDGGFILLEDA
tara:strand:+ start:341 stop:760 length:420 start_codon:yes stop_codon:yes gene_type:complete